MLIHNFSLHPTLLSTTYRCEAQKYLDYETRVVSKIGIEFECLDCLESMLWFPPALLVTVKHVSLSQRWDS
jgi:hypothetical protein